MRSLRRPLNRFRLPLALALVLGLLGGWWRWGGEAPLIPSGDSFLVTDHEERPLRLYTTADGYWRLPVKVDRLDPLFVNTLLRIEDKRYFEHAGVDLLAMLRAVGQVLANGRVVSGASTISMQAARLCEPRPRTVWSKLVEMGRAWALERDLSKQELLALYLRLTPYGGNLQGVRAASRFYFGKEPHKLDPAEVALLIALPQAPESLRPDRHPRAARAARDRILRRMAAQGLIDADQLRRGLRRAVPVTRRAVPALAPHLADRLRTQSKSSQVRTSLDAGLQRRVERLLQGLKAGIEPEATAAVLVVRNSDRRVLAYAGSADYWSANAGQVDHVTALRSPGSALKPFVYAMAFERKLAHPNTLVQDSPARFGAYRPANFDQRFHGRLTLARALQLSLNVPAVALAQAVGPGRMVQRLRDGGTDLVLPSGETRPSLAVVLGGVGTNLESLVRAYAALGAGGRSCALRAIAGKGAGRCRQLVDADAASLTTGVLLGVARPAGGGRHQVAFKTGTSYGFRDAWAIGYDAEHTVGVWVGRPDGAARAAVPAARTAAPLLFRVFDLLPRADAAPAVIPASGPDGLRRLALSRQPLRILNPMDGSTVRPGRNGQVQVEAAGGREPLRWLVNGRPMQGLADTRLLALVEPSGELRVTAIDADGRNASVRVRVQ